MPKKFPLEFKRDVVTVARRGDLTVNEVAADFDISVESVRRWMRQADIDDGIKDGLTVNGQVFGPRWWPSKVPTPRVDQRLFGAPPCLVRASRMR